MLVKNSLLCAILVSLSSYKSTVRTKITLLNINTNQTEHISDNAHKTKNITTIKFNKIVHDFGSINQLSTYQTYFKITNTGKYPLLIEKVDASCGCTNVLFSKKMILPKQSTRIEVYFHPRKNEKSFQKIIAIVANTHPKISLLTIKGHLNY